MDDQQLVLQFPKECARVLLEYSWGSRFTDLDEDPRNKNWYIDERANPDKFWALVALAAPYIFRRRKMKMSKTHLKKALDLLLVEENLAILQNHSEFLKLKSFYD